ncbi:LysE family transporter [Calderihabitans maritimus]|uniref:Lysine exporter protein LysE/YggA n=1 Tax=Calderihabitans maritimus TaxID=1246530 RepID=A0A1Z5HTZ1_9FIRM|nr:LysE family transporter [Calderihabitans maritimus]GAW93003.1 lysine exporter protein LysE/YggA [Calderihabitans maritimus]
MLNLWGIFASAFVVGLSGAMMPGPLFTVTVNESVRRGARAGGEVTLGHGILESLLVVGLIFGLSDILTLPLVSRTTAVLGGAVLVWFGYGIIGEAIKGLLSFSAATTQEITTGETKPLISWSTVVAGMVTSIANPYWILWWATIGVAFVTQALGQGTAGLVSFFAGHIAADLSWYLLVAVAAATGKRFLSDRIYRGILVICGLFLVVLALYFMYAGFSGNIIAGGD